MYKNNSGLIAKTKVCKYKEGQCLTEKLVQFNPLLFLYETVTNNLNRNNEIHFRSSNFNSVYVMW